MTFEGVTPGTMPCPIVKTGVSNLTLKSTQPNNTEMAAMGPPNKDW